MSLVDACKWLESTWISRGIRHSTWGFAMIEMVHLLALALAGGALIIILLRVFGLLFKAQRFERVLGDLGWILMGSLGAMVISGALLFADGPLRYYGNIAFRWKLVLIGAAAAMGCTTHFIGRRAGSEEKPRVSLQVTASLGCTFLIGAAIAGRVIGVL